MKQNERNKMATMPVCGLLWQMGLPMVVSMILQAVYNIVDTAFVINMGESGVSGNLALTYAFPIQLLIIAVGVGTGVGLNALLSKSLGEGDSQKANKTVGNGIFLGIVIYAIFLVFGLFFAKPFIEMQAKGNKIVSKMGTEYLKICCCFSFGAIGFTIYERFLQSTGRTLFSTISQIIGAVANIILDYVFIYPLGMGISGAAYATVIGQVLSLVSAAMFHYLTNKELKNSIKSLVPNGKIIAEIYKIGASAALMQGLLSVMMLGVNLILGTVSTGAELLQGAFGVYYKIMQFALFACFGLSNTIISALSYNYGANDVERSGKCVLWGIVNTLIVSAVIVVLFEILASPLASLFALASGAGGEEIKDAVVTAIRVASLGYVFMGFSIAVQGILQALRYAISPLIISALRLGVFPFPLVFAMTLTANPAQNIWWAFPVSELLTAVISAFILLYALKRKSLLRERRKTAACAE